MKITHVAFAATILLVGAAIYLLMDARAAKDKEQLSNEINKMKSDMAEMRKQPTVIPSPAEPQTADPSLEPATSVADNKVAAANPGAGASKALPKNGAPPKASPGVAKSTQGSPKTTQPSVTDVVAKGENHPAANPGVDPSLPNPLDDLKVPKEEQDLLDAATAAATPAATTPRTNKMQTMLRGLSAIAAVKSFDEKFGFVVLDAGTNRGLEKGMKFSVRRTDERGGVMIVGKIQIGQTVNAAECIADVDLKSVPVGVTIQPKDEIVQYE